MTATSGQVATRGFTRIGIGGFGRLSFGHIPRFVAAPVNQRVVLRQTRVAQQVAVGGELDDSNTIIDSQPQRALQRSVQSIGEVRTGKVEVFRLFFQLIPQILLVGEGSRLGRMVVGSGLEVTGKGITLVQGIAVLVTRRRALASQSLLLSKLFVPRNAVGHLISFVVGI